MKIGEKFIFMSIPRLMAFPRDDGAGSFLAFFSQSNTVGVCHRAAGFITIVKDGLSLLQKRKSEI